MLFVHGFATLSGLNRDRDKKLDHSLMLVGLQVRLVDDSFLTAQRGPYWTSHFLLETILSFFSVWLVISMWMVSSHLMHR